MTLAGELRAWAKGSHTSVAGTEMLLRGFGGRFASAANPWIHTSATPKGVFFFAGVLKCGRRHVLPHDPGAQP